MNAEEYIVERLQKLEEQNKNLRDLVSSQNANLTELKNQINALVNLYDKSKLEFVFNPQFNSYSLHFKGYYSSISQDGSDNIKEIVNDLKMLNFDSNIVLEVEKREQK